MRGPELDKASPELRCSKEIGLDESAANTTVACPYCSKPMQVPAPTATIPPVQRASATPRKPGFWTGGRAFGLLLILAAIVLVVVAFTAEYESQGGHSEEYGPVKYVGGYGHRSSRYVLNPPSLTKEGKGCLIAAAVCAGIGTFVMFLAGPSRKVKKS